MVLKSFLRVQLANIRPVFEGDSYLLDIACWVTIKMADASST